MAAWRNLVAQATPGLCGMAATLTGVGVARFAYVAILPVLVQQGWFRREAAGQLGAANLTGYLLGIGVAAVLASRFSAGALVRWSMLACTLSLCACAWRGGGMPWFLFWRTVAGACGSILMVQAPVLILPRVGAARRGRVAGLIFSGVGLGIIAAATVVPSLAAYGLLSAWLGLGGICALLTLATWRYWRAESAAAAAAAAASPPKAAAVRRVRQGFTGPIMLLCLAYTLNAVGYLPHTLFWADYITRELHQPLAAAGFFWGCFGLGAACGPYLTGVLADRFGLSRTLGVGFTLKAFGVQLCARNRRRRSASAQLDGDEPVLFAGPGRRRQRDGDTHERTGLVCRAVLDQQLRAGAVGLVRPCDLRAALAPCGG
jgi:MFS family permease